jgi:hypothetical protein
MMSGKAALIEIASGSTALEFRYAGNERLCGEIVRALSEGTGAVQVRITAADGRLIEGYVECFYVESSGTVRLGFAGTPSYAAPPAENVN